MRKFKKGQWVWWHDPAKESSGLYTVVDPKEEYNAECMEVDIAQSDERIILIGNQDGSQIEVYAQELESPRMQVVFRRWWDHPMQPVIAMFPRLLIDENQCLILAYQSGCKIQVNYQRVIRESVEATKKEYEPLLAALREQGCDELYVTTDRQFRRDQIIESANALARKECAEKVRKPIQDLHDQCGKLKEEYSQIYKDSLTTYFARLAILAGYEEKEPTPRMICPVCKGTDVACDARINPNTGEILGYPDDMDSICNRCGETVLAEQPK